MPAGMRLFAALPGRENSAEQGSKRQPDDPGGSVSQTLGTVRL
jgi:hypothetical protein